MIFVNTELLANFPNEPKAYSQWVLYRVANGKKVPLDAKNGRNASVSDASTWSTFQDVCDAIEEQRYPGILVPGFVLTKDDPFFVIDKDHCVKKDEITLSEDAKQDSKAIDSFTEYSLNDGAHIWGKTTDSPTTGRRTNGTEFYFCDRGIIVTGRRCKGSPLTLNDRTEQLREWFAAKFPERVVPTGTNVADGPPAMDDATVLKKAFAAENGPKVKALYDGDTDGYPSPSEAGAALASRLWFWTHDKAQVRRLMMDSKLDHSKWNSEKDWNRKFDKIFDPAKPFYRPRFDDHTENDFNDHGYATRFVELVKKDAIYLHDKDVWCFYTGTRFLEDRNGKAVRRAIQTADTFELAALENYERVEKLGDKALLRKAQRFLDFARKTYNTKNIQDMLKQARCFEQLAYVSDNVDTNKFLFNCVNGTLDLSVDSIDKVLRPHNRDDLITKLAPVVYDPEARSDLVDKYFEEMLGDTASYIQQVLGYSLTGINDLELVPFLHGKGRTGKGTLMGMIMATWGDYCITSDFRTFIAKSGYRSGGPNENLAVLAGAYVVIVNEFPDGVALDTQLIKTIAGGPSDSIRARGMYESSTEGVATYKAWLIANDAPKVPAGEDAVHRRIRRIPFRRVVSEDKADVTFKRRLMEKPANRSAFLARAVRGWFDLKANDMKLAMPESVKESTKKYWEENDPTYSFVTTVADLKAGEEKWFDVSADVYAAFCYHCYISGVKPVSHQKFTSALERCHGVVASPKGPITLKDVNGGKAFRPLYGIKVKEAFKTEAAAWRKAMSAGQRDPADGKY